MHILKKVLVVGATGCLGQNATEQLLSNGLASVRATGRDVKVGQALTARGADFVALDLRKASAQDYRSLLEGCDVVWYCAGTHVDREYPWEEHEAVNYLAVTEMFKVAREMGTVRRFIYVSTAEIYDDGVSRVDISESYRSELRPDDYIRTKLMAESFLKGVGSTARSLRISIIRPSVFYGPYDRHTIPPIADEVRREGQLLLPRGGNALKDYTYVGNVVYAMYLATVSPFSRGETYNITDGEPVTVKAFFGRLFELSGIPFKVGTRPLSWLSVMCKLDTVRNAPNSVVNEWSLARWNSDFTLNIEHAQQQLAYAPFVPMDEALQLTANWLKERYSF